MRPRHTSWGTGSESHIDTYIHKDDVADIPAADVLVEGITTGKRELWHPGGKTVRRTSG